jgi:hypothetical protein
LFHAYIPIESVADRIPRHQEVLTNDGPLLLPPDDPRCQRVSRITARLITALEEQENHVVSGATWPPRSQELGRVLAERDAAMGLVHRGEGEYRVRYQPSGTAKSTFMPWRPATSNPLKKLESADWNLYVIDMVRPASRVVLWIVRNSVAVMS